LEFVRSLKQRDKIV